MNTKVRSSLVRTQQGTRLGWFDVDPHESEITARAYALVNPESVGSATGILSLLERDAAAVRRDKELSDAGKANRIGALAKSRLENLAPLARKVIELETEYRAGETEALRLPEASPSETLIDLALAAHVREVDEGAVRIRLLADDRTKLALSRVPAALSGLNPDEQTKIRHSLLPATVAQRLDAESHAVSAARGTVQQAIDALTGHAPDIAHRELVGLFGDGWKLRGAVSQEERLARIRQQLNQDGAPAASSGAE